ncbi:glycosyltransferase family 39 protein [Limoniibacter endophyticus]|uniref:Glycosyltransferase RgtA/B/C/D-like domain-containing protein n=1 Tax=Limoniibacter endophyticus TaxID=1565040 RepID=A0A8J3GFR7_9HYPH|nr:glycosyltransferase family 39 protein [Limoniibacter endophyticus]GHC68631.1 hypothetical protein GCM10010136_13530 [Limoniibacter endophyticus]
MKYVDRFVPHVVIAAVYTVYYRWFSLFVKPNEHPDERHHITYVMDVVLGGITPNYTPGVSAVYLEHPFLYYFLTGKFAAFFADPVVGMHVANYGYGLLSVIVIFDFAKTISGNAMRGLVAAVCAITVPYFVYLATGVNNDNFATLLVFATAAAAARYHASCDAKWFNAAVAFVLLAGLVKATAAIQAGMILLPACYVALRSRGLKSIPETIISPMVALPLALFCLYYATIVGIYGEPFPRPVNFYVMAKAQVPQAFMAEPMDIGRYLDKYARDMLTQMSGIYSHTVYRYTQGYVNFWSLAYLVSVASCLVAITSARLRCVALGLLGALVVFGLMHIFIMYRNHSATGYRGGIQFRYYLPVVQLMLAFSVSAILSLRMSSNIRVGLAILCMFAFFDHDGKRYMMPAFMKSRSQ